MAQKSIIPIFVPHMGCPHDCVFCNQRRISGHNGHTSPDSVRRIIEEALNKLPPGINAEAAFYGGSFTAIPRPEMVALLETAYGFIKAGRLASIRVSTRPDAISADILDELSRYGVKTVEIGVQSMDDDILVSSRRGHNAQNSREAFNLLREQGFFTVAQMMCYLPGDGDGERSVFTAREILKLKPDGVRIYPVAVIRDSVLYDMWLKGEYIAPEVGTAARLCGRLIGIFTEAGVPVIRVGLNPTEDLSAGSAAAGAYHPAFGELAWGEYCLGLIEQALNGRILSDRLILKVPHRKISLFAGHKGINKRLLNEKYGFKEIKFLPADTNELIVTI